MNKKQTELLFNKFVLETFNASWGNDVLSAKKAEERYKSYGITPPHKIFYEYKFPENMSRYELLMRYDYMYNFQYFRAGDMLYQLDNLNELRPEHREIIIKYGREQIQDIEKYILDNKSKWADKMQYYVSEIKRLNPELKDIHVTSEKIDDLRKNNKFLTPEQYKKNANLNFVHGVVFGFSPDDIEYYLNRTEAQFKQDQNDEQLNFIRIGHVIAPKYRDDFVKSEQLIQKIENERKKNGQEL